LNSLIEQDSRCFEVVFSDGGSINGTIEHALAKLRNHGIEAFAIVAIGSSIYGAINHGVRTARGQWHCVLGSDDILYTATIFSEIQAVLNHSSGVLFMAMPGLRLRMDLSTAALLVKSLGRSEYLPPIYFLSCSSHRRARDKL
jgi:glycosyltransferase involved in cell wall biosynthesis